MTPSGWTSNDTTVVRRPHAVWAAALVVAVGAAVATAHGLYEVAHAAGAPAPIAALYPLITDGLALVAYASTTRLDAIGRRYAWTIVVLAAGLSGLAQAAFLAGGVRDVPAGLRFGIGAWPAIAAAIAAHLVYQLRVGVQPPSNVQPARTGGLDDSYDPVQPAVQPAVQPDVQLDVQPYGGLDGELDADPAPPSQPARDRARDVARAHRDRYGTWPRVNDLAAAAGVGRGTAATVLKELRAERPNLHVLHTDTTKRTDR